MANDKFDGGGCGKDEAKILLAFSTSKKLNRVGFLTSYTKKTFNLSRHAFIQVLIFRHFDPES